MKHLGALVVVALLVTGCAGGKVVNKHLDKDGAPLLIIRNSETKTRETVSPDMESYRRCSVGEIWPDCGRAGNN